MSPERQQQLAELGRRLGHTFADPDLLDRALTHTSYANESNDPGERHNEAFEFLGDAVLGFLVADLLHRRDPDGAEGQKSRARAALVSAPTLARKAAHLELPALLRLGRGEEKSGGRAKKALWADAVEAVLAAVYLDGGLPAARAVVSRVFGADLGDVADSALTDPKSALQELLQGRGDPPPEYVVLAIEGPDHQRRFRFGCRVDGRLLAEGEGRSKKQAQQQAALRALDALGGGALTGEDRAAE